MKREVHIDQYVKEKLDTLNVPFEDNYWLEAEKLIIEQEKRKRRGFFLWWILLALGALSAAFLILFSSDKRVEMNSNSKINNEIIEQNSTNTKSVELVELSGPDNNYQSSTINKKNNKKETNKRETKTKSLFVKTRTLNSYADDANKSVYSDSSKGILVSKDTSSIVMIPALNAILTSSSSEYNLWLSDDDNQKRKFNKNYLMGISAGFTINNTFKPGYFGSVHLQRMHSSKYFSRIAVQFSAVSFRDLQYKYSEREYSFGEQLVNYTIQSNTLYTLQVPISFHRKVYRSTFVHTGLLYSHYFAQENIVQKEIAGKIENSKLVGKSKDFRTSNFALLLGIETKLMRNYQIGLSTQYSFLKSVNNTAKLNGTNNNNLLETRVYLIYHLYRIK